MMMMNKDDTETATAEELLRKIQKLEQDHRQLVMKQNNMTSHKLETLDWTETQYMNILESMGQSVYMFDVNNRIVYWNQKAENLYGYTAAEAVGKTPPEIIIGPEYSDLSLVIIQRVILNGETWSGQFPVRTKFGEDFNVVTTLSPCRHEQTTFAVTCVCADARPHFPLQSTHHHLPRMMMSSSSPGPSMGEHFTTADSNEGGESSFHKLLSLISETWMDKTAGIISWPWKLPNDHNRDTSDITSRFCASSEVERPHESPSDDATESPGSYSPGTSSSCSVDTTNKTSIHLIENLDVEILWEDLIIRQQIEQGSPGTVYHASLYGSDVAVKIFNKQEFPDDKIVSFRKEVCLMKRLRHPNILLFMGAVISPLHLCIITEFLPRGSLFRLLQRSTTKLKWRRRIHMAMDIARGMNYLHHCQPPIIHRNLKSSNILVDKNLTLKVGDFGLSRIKHETYLATYTSAGTAQWMAPEVFRDEQVDEKSDVYSYGVVLWEITTGKIPWENLNSMQQWKLQVIGAVGFMNQQLEIPNDVDPQWASLIQSCWSSEPRYRPTFEQILIKLKDLWKKFNRAAIAHKNLAAKRDHEDAS